MSTSSNRPSKKPSGQESSARASKSTFRHARRESQKGILPNRGGPRSSKASGKGSRLNNGADSGATGSRSQVQIFDESGADVTPKAMLFLKGSMPPGKAVQGTPGNSIPAENSTSDAYTMERMSMSARFSRSTSDRTQEGSTGSFGGGYESNHRSAEKEEREMAGYSGETVATNRDRKGGARPETWLDATTPAKPRGRADEHGEYRDCISLRESDTFWLLGVPGRCVASDSPEATAVEEANGRYRSLLKARQGSELYVDVAIQTVNNIVKSKEIQSVSESCTQKHSQVTGWEIHDAFHANQAEVTQEGLQDGPVTSEKPTSAARLGKSSVASGVAGNTSPSPSLEIVDLDGAMANMEKAILQNVYHEKMLLYRDHHVVQKEGSTKNDRAIMHLWNFRCGLTDGRNVSCVAWNKIKPDLLVVGYGEFDFTSQRDGLVAFWSLKNPDNPERTFATPFGVTALDFSSTNYNLLAVGLYDGTVSIYDVRALTDKPVLESGHGVPGKHSDPVWKVRWVKRGPDRDEALVSISTDGRVTQWSLKKGLEYIDLMKLKRVARKTTVVVGTNNSSAPQTEAFISRRGSGTCFDFSAKDASIYVTGTEDGMLHKCSCSYSEQYLESYFGHNGPVHQVRWSPFASNVFISASADWTIKLWKEESSNPVLTFQSGNEQISDVCWSPTNPTVFASTSLDGRLEVWDLSMSTLKPIMSTTVLGEKLSCLMFSETSPIIVAGGHGGIVGVFRLVGIERPVGDGNEPRRRLDEAMASDFSTA